MGQEIKSKINMHTIDLMDKTDMLKSRYDNNEVVDLLNRATNLGSIAILYFSELTDEELGQVEALLQLLSNLDTDNIDSVKEQYASLENLVSSIEKLYRSKKLLLDSKQEKKIA